MKITVIIRDDSPMLFCGDSPRYRTKVIKLTKEQINQIELKCIGRQAGKDMYEEISSCILEGE